MGSMMRRREGLKKKFGFDGKKADAIAACIETLHCLGDAMSNATWEWTSEGNLDKMLNEIEANFRAGQDAFTELKRELGR